MLTGPSKKDSRVADETVLEMSNIESKKKKMIMSEPVRPVSISFDRGDMPVTSGISDPEVGSGGENEDVGYAVNGQRNEVVMHKSMFTRRKLRATCICFVMMILLFALWQRSLTAKDPGANPVCDEKKSAPYTSNRNVSWDMCVEHQPDDWLNKDLTDFLLPGSKAASTPPIRFLVVGDFGRDGYCCQRDVAVEMDRAGRAINAEFVINTGDTFYDGGIMTSSDEQIKTSFLNVYNQTFLKTLTFLTAIGNHEYRGSIPALLQVPGKNRRMEVGKDGKRWFTKVITSSGSKPMHLQLVFLDTTPMIPSYRTPKYDSPDDIMLQRKEGVSSQWDKVEEQVSWLEDRLQNDRYDFVMRIVIGHHPVYDQSSHVGENRTFLQERIAPLLEKYNVTAAFAGHDHNLQMLQPRETAYFVSGAGSKITPAAQSTPDTPDSAVRFYYLEHGFLACTAYPDELRVAVVDKLGQMLDKVVVRIRKDED